MLRFASRKAFVLSDRQIVKDLMDKRNSITSNRPPAEILENLLYDGDEMLLWQPSNPRWRTARKFLHQNFMSSMVENTHMPLIDAEATQLLRDILEDPQNFLQHSKRFGNSFMMSVGYGIRTPTVQTRHMVQIGKVLARTTELLQPGGLPPVDLFPFLRWVPQQFLGFWRDKVSQTRKEINDLYLGYFDLVIARREAQGRVECFADRVIEQQNSLQWNRHQQAFMAGLLMEAGSDTVASAMNAFFNLILANPEWAKKAQKQIDGVIGEDRAPTLADLEKLPIVNAIIKETLRLKPIAPVGFPHALTEDTWVNGHFLPKGSDLIVNIYAIHRDEERFPNPEAFDPGRYLDKPALADEYAHLANYEARDHYSYGVGRRLCPGIHLAERALFTTIAKSLWAFDITPQLDSDGRPYPIDTSSETGYADGVAIGPLPFPCEIKVRSERREKTILQEYANAERTVFPIYSVPKE
ncbi:uncharacterized protein A1O5_11689 [Cladophialophora psammophila CBS 110553]|uniref:Cytochrome P450 oxidoreductase n=1 Tax=Cladophialophora psammophila CBS 110553 TaxID=1182543 RepID=W9W5Z9_9EURO|nr:uncharacterized protein A1O5_11689 [Cladophialophora psammophila CBS 110553]EXJ63368.1 hypothetical protein A1O5_11689 [Cladophialophora psammophila CBS 110553]